MILKSNRPNPLFFDEQFEIDRLRKLEKRQNEFALSMNKEDAFKFVEWLSKRNLFCMKCKEEFYSNVGYVNHGCMK